MHIVCSMINKYRPPLKTSDNCDLSLGYKMLIKSRENANALKQLTTKDTHAFRAYSKSWKRIDANEVVVDFPVLSLDEVRELTFGVYQVR